MPESLQQKSSSFLIFFPFLENDFQITLYFNCKWVQTYWTFKEFINLNVPQPGLTWICAVKRALLQDFRVCQDSCCTDILQWTVLLAGIFCNLIPFLLCALTYNSNQFHYAPQRTGWQLDQQGLNYHGATLNFLLHASKRGTWSHLCNQLCIKLLIGMQNVLYTHFYVCSWFQVVDLPYLKLLKYLINVILLKESFELLKKLNEEYYMNAHKYPCVVWCWQS